MDSLKQRLITSLERFAGEGLGGYAFLTVNAEANVFVVTDIAITQGKREVHTSIFVRLLGETILIEQDDNEPPLVDALLQAGIPRSQIILAYAGEPVPESA